MRDRYEDKELELDLEERTGYKFIKCAQTIYMELTHVPDSRQVKIRDKLPALKQAIEDVMAISQEFENRHAKFVIGDTLYADYQLAKERYLHTRQNPEFFRQKDEQRRLELEHERDSLADKIKIQEIEFARAEDERRHLINAERARLNAELENLQAKKVKYEQRLSASKIKCLPMCVKRYKNKLPPINARIEAINQTLKELGNIRKKYLDDKHYQLNLLHKRRWDVEKQLNARQENGPHKMSRRQHAIDNSEVVMMVRRMDIDHAIERYYSLCSVQLAHAFLNVYALIQETLLQHFEHTEKLSAAYLELLAYAEKLYCPDIAFRSIDTLYKKLQLLSVEERNQVTHKKPVDNQLSEVLMRSISSKNVMNAVTPKGMFRHPAGESKKPVDSTLALTRNKN